MSENNWTYAIVDEHLQPLWDTGEQDFTVALTESYNYYRAFIVVVERGPGWQMISPVSVEGLIFPHWVAADWKE